MEGDAGIFHAQGVVHVTRSLVPDKEEGLAVAEGGEGAKASERADGYEETTPLVHLGELPERRGGIGGGVAGEESKGVMSLIATTLRRGMYCHKSHQKPVDCRVGRHPHSTWARPDIAAFCHPTGGQEEGPPHRLPVVPVHDAAEVDGIPPFSRPVVLGAYAVSGWTRHNRVGAPTHRRARYPKRTVH